MIKAFFKGVQRQLGWVAALLAILSFAVTALRMTEEMAQLKKEAALQRLEMIELREGLSDKEKTCLGMIHAIRVAKLEYRYCKEEYDVESD